MQNHLRRKRIRRWMAVAVVLTVLIGAVGVLATGSYLSDGQRRAAATVPLASFYPPNAIEQTFVSRCDGLARVDVWLSSPGQARYARVALQSEDRKTLFAAEFLTLAGQEMRHSLTFPPVPDSAGKRFRLLWQGEGYPLALETSAADTDAEGTLSISGTPTGHDLISMRYYRPPTPAAWGCAVTERARAAWAPVERLLLRIGQYKPGYLKSRSLILWGGTFLVALALLIGHFIAATRRPSRLLSAWLLWPALIALATLVSLSGWLLVRDKTWPGEHEIQLAAGGISPGVGQEDTIVKDLLLAFGESETAVSAREAWYVTAKWLHVTGYRPALWMHPPSHVSFPVEVPPEGRLAFSVGLDAETWEKPESDGVEFVVIVSTTGTLDQVYWRAVDPANVAEDRRWFDEQVDLSRYAGQEVTLTLSTYPRGNNSWDWAGWGHPVITGRPIE